MLFFALPVAKDLFRVRSLYISYPSSSTPPSDTQSAITLARAAIVLREGTDRKQYGCPAPREEFLITKEGQMYVELLIARVCVAASRAGQLPKAFPSILETLMILRMDWITDDG